MRKKDHHVFIKNVYKVKKYCSKRVKAQLIFAVFLLLKDVNLEYL